MIFGLGGVLGKSMVVELELKAAWDGNTHGSSDCRSGLKWSSGRIGKLASNQVVISNRIIHTSNQLAGLMSV